MTRTAFLDGPLRTATGVLAAVALLAAGWFGLSWYRAAHDESLALRMTRDTVLQDGQQATVNLNTLDYRRVQDGLTLWEQSAHYLMRCRPTGTRTPAPSPTRKRPRPRGLLTARSPSSTSVRVPRGCSSVWTSLPTASKVTRAAYAGA